jgi:hypothetical protein
MIKPHLSTTYIAAISHAVIEILPASHWLKIGL